VRSGKKAWTSISRVEPFATRQEKAWPEEIGETFRYVCSAGAAARRQLQSKLNASGAVNRREADSLEFRPKNVDTDAMTPTNGKHRYGHFCRLKHLCDFFVSITPSQRKGIEGFSWAHSENRT
jgi:hypothetical protein